MKKQKIERVVIALNEDGSFRAASVQHFDGDRLPRPLEDPKALTEALGGIELAASSRVTSLQSDLDAANHAARVAAKRASKAEELLEAVQKERDELAGRLEGALSMLRDAEARKDQAPVLA